MKYLIPIVMMTFISCNIINPAEPIPAYLHVDTFSVYSDNATQGSSSSNIHDVWATVDGTALGTYELPATFPVLAVGSHEVKLTAGILVNGITSIRAAYPLYTSFDTTINLESAKTFTINPKVTYASFCTFSQMEDFDHPGVSFDTTSASNVALVDTINSNSIEGKFGYVYLDNSHPNFECASHNLLTLPGGGANVYAELNYKCNNEFVVGLFGNISTSVYVTDILTVRTTDLWKKIYIDLTPTVSQLIGASGWKLYIRATKSTSQSTAELYFDNIKVIH
jgi:hypothetical protein